MSERYVPTAEWTPNMECTCRIARTTGHQSYCSKASDADGVTQAAVSASQQIAAGYDRTELEDFVDHDWTDEHATDWSQFGYR